MFKNPPQIYAHQSALKNGNFVIEEEIIFHDNGQYCLKSRECPHRGYTMYENGDVVKTVVCKLHGFAWDQNGNPLKQGEPRDHFYKLHHHGDIELGQTGLLFKNFKEDLSVEWQQQLSKETDLEFDRTIRIESPGSWLWSFEQLTDVLHIRQNGIHPRQSLETPLTQGVIENTIGEDFVVQRYKTDSITGYWVFVFPWFGIEFEPGKLVITRIIPNDVNNEFGYRWEAQFYYAPWVDKDEKEAWEKCIEVYMEDIQAVEKIKRPFFPLKKTTSHWEDQMYHWGQWYLKNRINDSNSQK